MFLRILMLTNCCGGDIFMDALACLSPDFRLFVCWQYMIQHKICIDSFIQKEAGQ